MSAAESLAVSGLRVSYAVRGRGPALVLPACNIEWSKPVIETLSAHHRLVMVSPRGFAGSQRGAGAYDGDIRSDIEAVLDHLGIGCYASVGYSMTGSMAALLAVDNPRVSAVVAGGFPLSGGYRRVREHVRAVATDFRSSPARWSEYVRRHDPDAVDAYYSRLAGLPDGILLDRVTCDVFAFWGGDDEIVEETYGLDRLRNDLRQRGTRHVVLAGQNHAGLIDGALTTVLAEAMDWLGGAQQC